MLNVVDVKLAFGKRVLFKDVNINFSPGNCYGLIGANGSGKSTFLKILSGEIEPNSGEVVRNPKERIAVLRQDQSAFDELPVLETVIMGHPKLHDVLKERDLIYSKEDFTDEDGHRAAELEELLDEMNGYEAEADAATLLSGLGLADELHQKKMKELEGGEKVRVLLAQALFGNPDILLLDEPTNNLDIESITWLENFLYNFSNTVIVVSHDRHFINKVCTHIADIDFGKIMVYAGNYDFWAQSIELAIKQKKEENKKKEDKIKELQSFIERFSSNASKARQATSRKKLLEKLTLDEIPVTSRRFPYVAFKPDRECGKMVLSIENLGKAIDGEAVLTGFNLVANRNDKIAFVGPNNLVKTVLFQIIMGEMKPDSGDYRWGETITSAYFPKENSSFFEGEKNLVDWLRQYTAINDETYVRGFLGRMLFSGEESLKKVNVLSGGERVRCMLARMMLSGANAMVLDDPTNHLDLESITSLNNGLINFNGVLLFSSHDYQFIDSIANRIVEITPSGVIDRAMTFEEYINSDEVRAIRDECYHGHQRLSI
ncbi:MAG TPA: ATP-binding cassette domain-containing protein [Spirochaetota bacterium]|nr:ATP-binding cassette domain-containing protein [Spirochaetota bacterium]HPC40795.1 ATP-binding cassette domain-containing protein [Spirochaetota bacterium]HPL15756.1 ATP-binding cassette domain-containing protein [Spirochaetota bacterium]HQF07815.1 ATP-binding cassette domain-containing protein [Spirochaetota bacterium]HQH96868.1 ATP-binding cassette domain-containing protein [Spirochaetota bacterium]